MNIPIVDPNTPTLQEQLDQVKAGAITNLAASIAKDVSNHPNFLDRIKDWAYHTPDELAEAVALYALGIASRVIGNYNPKVNG